MATQSAGKQGAGKKSGKAVAGRVRWLQPGDQINFTVESVVRTLATLESGWNTDASDQGWGFLRVLDGKVKSDSGALANVTQHKSSFLFGRQRQDLQLYWTAADDGTTLIGLQAQQGRQWFGAKDHLTYRPLNWTGVKSLRCYDAMLLGAPPVEVYRQKQELVAVDAGDFEAIPFVGSETQTLQMDILGKAMPYDVQTAVKIWYSLEGLPLKMEIGVSQIGYALTAVAEASKISLHKQPK